MGAKRRRGPGKPERGFCEPDIIEEPQFVPDERPEPIPQGIPVEAPGIPVEI